MAEEEEAPPAEETTEDVTEPFEPIAESTQIEPSGPIAESTPISSEKRARIQIDPNASVQESSLYFTSIPPIPAEPGQYQSFLYTFRVKPQDESVRLKQMRAKSPPFYLLFDHTIAVLWTLFNPTADKKLLGIDQLHWAKFFLEPIRHSQGTYPVGVALALETIRDFLIAAYASMSETVSAYEPLNAGDSLQKYSVVRDSDSESQSQNFSFNYTQMISKYTEPKDSKKGGCVVDAKIKAELDDLKKLYGVDAGDDLCAKETVDDIMINWKSEQINLIQNAIKTLHHISDIKKTLDSEEEDEKADLLARLDQLIAEFDNIVEQ